MPGATTAQIGIVGLGGMGRLHAESIEELGHDIVAGADIVEDQRTEFESAHDVPTFEDFTAMYDDVALDGVVITTPNKFHEQAATAAFDRDINVLCEKPLAHDLQAAESMVAAESSSNAFGTIGFQSRFKPSTQLFRAHDDRGRFGEIRHVEVKSIRRRGIPGTGSWFTNEELSGGGALIDIGVHSLDLVLYLLGFPRVSEVSATTRADFGTRQDYVDPDGWCGHWDTSEGGFDVEDSASAFIRCDGDLTISFEVAWAANRVPPEDNIHVWGTEAGATFKSDGGLQINDTDDAGMDQYVDTEVHGNQSKSPQTLKDEMFIEAIVDGGTPSISFQQGLAVQRLMDAIYRSSEEGHAIQL